ncbi:B-cell receptor-associated protein 31-like-domain-containing protein [Phlyctochytrium arcticum]|nr:B-cell receptor-associated protein 31-like-domain-containing protein [Phlyctochytrium arcticum]
MSLFNQIVYYLLLAELAFFVVSLVPLTFIPIATRRRLMDRVSALATKQPVVWAARILFFVVTLVFCDTLNRLYKMESEYTKEEQIAHPGHPTRDALADLQQKARRFYTQRNLYLSLFAMLMVLVNYFRMKDLYVQLLYQQQIADLKNNVRLMKQQVEVLTRASVRDSSSSKIAPKPTTTAATAEIDTPTGKIVETLLDSDVSGTGSARKRNAKGVSE